MGHFSMEIYALPGSHLTGNQQAGPEEDEALITVLAMIEGRRLQLFGPTALGEPACNVVLPATR